MTFSENIGISDTRSNEVAIAITVMTVSRISGSISIDIPESIEPEPERSAQISDDQKMACAGTGRPINVVVCRVSLLNFAKRKAEQTGIASAEM